MVDEQQKAVNEPLPFPTLIPFAQTLGFELWAFGEGHAELRVTLSEGLTNSRDVAHGGVLMTLLDVAMAHAAKSVRVNEAGQPSSMATIEMKTSFMRPAQGHLRALAKLVHHTSSLAFTEGTVLDERGRICAQATGTFKYVRPVVHATSHPETA